MSMNRSLYRRAGVASAVLCALLYVMPASAKVVQLCAVQSNAVSAANSLYNAASAAVAFDLSHSSVSVNQTLHDALTLSAATTALSLANQSLATCQSGG